MEESMIRRTAVSALVTSALLVAISASAEVPSPVGAPPPAGESPATGDLPPIPPPPSDTPAEPPATPTDADELPPIPAPEGRPSNPQHPDPNVGNRPPASWYTDMYHEVYDSSYYYSKMERWAYHEYTRTHSQDAYNLYVYAAYLRYYTTQYFWTFYEYGSDHKTIQPKYYSRWGYHATRGDYNYAYHYYIRPVYREYVRYASYYYNRHYRDRDYNYDYGYGKYSDHAYYASKHYHSYVKCNYGKNGTDPQAKDDTEMASWEQSAGIESP
jgi:hypothetical protein